MRSEVLLPNCRMVVRGLDLAHPKGSVKPLLVHLMILHAIPQSLRRPGAHLHSLVEMFSERFQPMNSSALKKYVSRQIPTTIPQGISQFFNNKIRVPQELQKRNFSHTNFTFSGGHHHEEPD